MMRECPIIELIGVPGSGKTTAIKYALQQLEKDGVRVLFLNDLFANKLELVKGALKGWLIYSGLTSGERTAWKNYTKRIDGVPFFILKKIDWFERLQFLYCYQTIEKLSSKYDVILSDQWIYQHAFSILHDQHMQDYLSDLLELDSEVGVLFKGKYYIIRCDLNLEENVKRLQSRVHGQSVIDGLKPEKILKICKVQIDNISYFSDAFLKNVSYSVDFNGNQKECAESIITTIKEIVG